MRKTWLCQFAFVAALVVCAAPVLAQTCAEKYCSFTHRWIPCNQECYPSSPPATAPSGPSAADNEAARKREAERLRLEELQRQAELEWQRQEEERKRAQHALEAAVADAARHLKGVSQSEMGLKGVSGNNTAFFGLKGVSPAEAGTLIKTAPPGSSSSDVSSASKQLTCAADISGYAFQHALKIASGAGTQADVDEISYLAGAAGRALDGQQPGVECKSDGILKFTKAPDLKTIAPVYKAGMANLVLDSQRLYDLQRQSQQPARPQQSLQAETSPAPRPTPASRPAQTVEEAQAAKAFAESQQWRERDFKEHIEPVIEQQKKTQKQQEDACDACKLLETANGQLTAIEAQKSAATKALTDDVKKVADSLER